MFVLDLAKFGTASCKVSVCIYVYISVVDASLKKRN
eukprot:COSAG02_NODE_43978_length_370_cov_0.601476_1_plen_35_part_01